MSSLSAVLSELRAAIPDARPAAVLADCSTWRIGGPADLLVEPASVDALSRALALTASADVPTVIIGCGSNLLFDDAGVRGVVIRMGQGMAGFTIEGDVIRAQAGATMYDLARAAARAGLSGLEHTAGIPGTLGGLIAMNGGSRRRAIGDNLRQVDVLDRSGRRQCVAACDCGFGYRTSVFQRNDCIVVGAEIVCERGEPAVIEQDITEDLAERERKFPLDLPNCGSVFTNSQAIYERFGPPGRVIEDTGLKGLRVGDIEVSPKHANFMVNHGHGRSADVLECIRRVREAVYERTGFWLECEVRYVSPEGLVRPAHLVC